ncbi:DUF1493 family protein [Microbulbifer elongatus]|uniref:DUF1493 family protein n=1 Tax=Microbulbifer elongatus TaxID=86173 RepID=A0ABT1NZR9_9GAMM|nr:DUF1493 family protein [Microbulbifer elongatus]MCQ3829370.1 DUF1493 family protein [Microbulbifer elongatus]
MKIEEIYNFLVEEQALKLEAIHPQSDLNTDLGVEGDDFSELIESFAEKYEVDMASYRWYFHHCEEGWNLGALIFKPPYMQVQRISVTPDILLQAAKSRVWPIQYPTHQLSEGRPDIFINKVILIGAAALAALMWFSRTSGA